MNDSVEEKEVREVIPEEWSERVRIKTDNEKPAANDVDLSLAQVHELDPIVDLTGFGLQSGTHIYFVPSCWYAFLSSRTLLKTVFHFRSVDVWRKRTVNLSQS